MSCDLAPTGRILIIDKEPSAVEALRLALVGAGFDAAVVAAPVAAEQSLRLLPPDLVLMDWNLPGVAEIEALRRLRAACGAERVAMIILSARLAEADVVAALNLGAEDCIGKPFSCREVIARIEAVLRGRRRALSRGNSIRGELELDAGARRVIARGEPLALRGAEYRLLEVLMRSSGRTLDRQQLRIRVWGSGSKVDERTVDVNVQRLRKRLATRGCQSLIHTVRGFGYRFAQSGRPG